MQNVVFLLLMFLGMTSWAQFDDVYSSSPWDFEEDTETIYTTADESYYASSNEATMQSNDDIYWDDNWVYDDYDFRYSQNLNRFYQPVYGATFYDFRYTNGYYYTYNPWDWGINIYVNYSPWRPRRWGWNTAWNSTWWGYAFGPTYSVTTYHGWVNPWLSMYNSWGYGGLGWNSGWYGGYSNWYGHQYWAYNNPFCSGFGFSYNDWYADAGSVHYGPRLGGKSYSGRTKSNSFVMQDDGFDNPRMRSQGLSMPAVSSEGRAAQNDYNSAASNAIHTGRTRQSIQVGNISSSVSHSSLNNQASERNAASKVGDNASNKEINQQGNGRGSVQSFDHTQTHRKTENVNSDFSSTNRNGNQAEKNSTLQQNGNQISRGGKTENNSNIQGSQRQQSSQQNGSFSNSRRSNSGNTSSGSNRSNQNNTKRSNAGGGNRLNRGSGGSSNGGGGNRSGGGSNSNPRSRGGGR